MPSTEHKKTTLFLILDAFRSDYIDPNITPCLWELSQKGTYVKKIKSSSGFTQRSSIFTGLWPDETGNFVMYGYKKGVSKQFLFLKLIPAFILDFIDAHWEFADRSLRYASNIILGKIFPKTYIPMQRIPYRLLPSIYSTEDQTPINAPRAFGDIESIFTVFAEKDVPLDFIMHPVSAGLTDDETTKRIIQSDVKNRFILGQLWFTDHDIHQAGVGSDRAIQVLRDTDNRVKAIKEAFDQKYDDYDLIIIGDHGMTNVSVYLDVAKYVQLEMKKNGFAFCKDYVFFLSSTLAHFWALSDAARVSLKKVLDSSFFQDKGFFLDADTCVKYHIPHLREEYGEFIWAANDKVLIYPDFFHKFKNEQYKAMHGYIGESDDMKGMAIYYQKNQNTIKQIEQGELIDLCPTICDSVGVRYPRQSKGRSFVV